MSDKKQDVNAVTTESNVEDQDYKVLGIDF
jgi:hypothetical protein